MARNTGTAEFYRVASAKLDALAKLGAKLRNNDPAFEAVNTLRKELGSLLSETAGAVNSAAKVATDKTMFISGRSERIKAQRDEFSKSMAGRLDVLDLLAESVRGVLAKAATRPLSRHEELTARHDAAYIIQHSEDKAAALQKLAARDDAIGGLVAGDFGRLLAETHVPSVDADTLHGAMRAKHVQAGLSSDDPNRKAAAEAFLDHKTVAQALASVKGTVNQGTEDLGDMARVFSEDPREKLAQAQAESLALPVSDDGEDD